jgi:ribonuclease Z
MTTTVTLTGTGVPHPSAGRAGAGVLVSYGDVHLQFDAGRGTVLRLADAGISPADLTAQFITHYHSDHVVDLVDVVITRWVMRQVKLMPPLDIVIPEGPTRTFVERMLDPYDDDILIRREHVGADPIEMNVMAFTASSQPTTVWTSADGSITVDAVAVHHEPVEAAVAYRVRTPDGSAVISGDTRVCDEVFELARGADVLVHEVCRRKSMAEAIQGTAFEKIFDYHADSEMLGTYAERYGIAHIVLTHLIPQPKTDKQIAGFTEDLRRGGYTGKVTVGADLVNVDIGGD